MVRGIQAMIPFPLLCRAMHASHGTPSRHLQNKPCNKRVAFPRMHRAMCCPPLRTAFWKHALPLEPIMCIFNVACPPAPAHDRPERNRTKTPGACRSGRSSCVLVAHHRQRMQVKNFPVPCTALVPPPIPRHRPPPFRKIAQARHQVLQRIRIGETSCRSTGHKTVHSSRRYRNGH
jgi:hypothetical protein